MLMFPRVFVALGFLVLTATGCANVAQTRAEHATKWRALGLQPPPPGYRYQGCRQYPDGFRDCRLVRDPWSARGRTSFRLSI